MCLPAAAFMALGASASTAATISTVGSIATAGMGALGAYNQARAQQGMARYNAAVADNNAQMAEWQAQDALRRGDEEAAAVRRQADQLKGSQRATMAAKGLDLAEGTAAELQDQTDFFGLIDQNTARGNAQREAWAARQQGQNFRSEAAMQRTTASNISPGMAVATSLLGSAGSVSDRWYSNTQGTTRWGTNPMSQQTRMLRAQERGM